MSVSFFCRFSVVLCLAAVVGCSSRAPELPLLANRDRVPALGQMQRVTGAPEHGTVYVSNGFNETVWKFPAGVVHPKPEKVNFKDIADPVGVAVDGFGTLYVLDNDESITEYPRGQLAPAVTISGINAQYIAAGKDGMLYTVDNYSKDQPVTEIYRKGQTKPWRTIDGDGPDYGLGPITVDDAGNFYVVYEGGSCCGTGVDIYLRTQDYNLQYLWGSQYFDGGLAALSNGTAFVSRKYDDGGRIRIAGQGLAPLRALTFSAPPSAEMAYDAADGLLYSVAPTYAKRGGGYVTIYDVRHRRVAGVINGLGSANSVAVAPASD